MNDRYEDQDLQQLIASALDAEVLRDQQTVSRSTVDAELAAIFASAGASPSTSRAAPPSPPGESSHRPDEADPQLLHAGQNCTILLANTVAFTPGFFRSVSGERLSSMQVMYEQLQDAFRSSGVSWEECRTENRGDGVLVIVPPALPTSLFVAPLLADLAEGLRQRTGRAGAAKPILQLRVAVHVGPVASDGYGASGDAIIHVARLQDWLRRRFARSGAHLGVMVSPFIHDIIARHGPGHAVPVSWERAPFRANGSRIPAWLGLYWD